MASFFSHQPLLTMNQSEISDRRIGLGLLVIISIVKSSIFLMSATFCTLVFASEPGERDLANVASTSSAVNGAPSWKVTFLRRLKRQTVGLTSCQDSAKAGSSPRSLLRRTSGS